MIYLDTAALVKLIRREPESDALADWLDEQEAPCLSPPRSPRLSYPRRCSAPNLISSFTFPHCSSGSRGTRSTTSYAALPQVTRHPNSARSTLFTWRPLKRCSADN
jgi:hypothetical protein